MFGDLEQRIADEDRVTGRRFLRGRSRRSRTVLAALVLVDPSDVDGERAADGVPLAKSPGWVAAGTSDPTPTTTDGTSRLPASWIIARSSGELANQRAHARENRFEHRQTDGRIAPAVGTGITRGDRPDAVVRGSSGS
jgi:hypothetical protein